MELYMAMAGLLPAFRPASQQVLDQLWAALLGISEGWRHVPGPCESPWEILIYTMVLVLIVKGRHIFRSVKALGKRCSAHTKVCGICRETMGPRIQADEALGPPGVEAYPLPLQTLCLSATNTNHSRLSLQDIVDFLEKAQKRQLSQGSGDTPMLRASEMDGELQKKIRDDLNVNAHVPERPELLAQEIARWRQEKEAGAVENTARAGPES